MLLAHWLDVPERQVRFYRNANDREGPQPGMLPPQRWSNRDHAGDGGGGGGGGAHERLGTQPLPPFPDDWPRDSHPLRCPATGCGRTSYPAHGKASA